MVFDAARGRIVLFGGRTWTARLDDTWEWDGTTWTRRSPVTNPSPRASHGLAYDPVRQRVVMFAGADTSIQYDDTWEWDGSTWILLGPVHHPAARWGHRMVYDLVRGRVMLFGSSTLDPSSEDVWEWDGTDWFRVLRSIAPQGRSGSAMVFDAVRSHSILFGGATGRLDHDDVWAWDGERWTELTPVIRPFARSGHGLAHDGARRMSVLFGGSNGVPPSRALFGDTWTWNGSAWTQAMPATSPSARSAPGLAFDPAAQRVLLFGGIDNSTVYGDTWTFDGANWTQAVTPVAPSARCALGLVSDGQRIVLFGGTTNFSGSWTYLSDTWMWTGSVWTQLAPVTSPPSRSHHSMVHDRDRNRVVLFGGFSLSPVWTLFEDTWEWGGINWSQLTPATGPSGRSGAAVAYDVAHQKIVMFGGARSVDMNDTWTLGAVGIHATYGNGCPGTLGTPSLRASPNSIPELGGTVQVDLTNLPRSIAAMVMGFSNTTTGTQPLPMPLAQFGMPGCDLLADPVATQLLVGAANAATWVLPVPHANALHGLESFQQAFVFDPGANAAGLTVSNAGRCRIGN
jgi:hypothetical protein